MPSGSNHLASNANQVPSGPDISVPGNVASLSPSSNDGDGDAELSRLSDSWQLPRTMGTAVLDKSLEEPMEPLVKDSDVPQYVHCRHDVTKSGLSFYHILRSLPYIAEPLYFSLKVALLVTLPLCLFAFHPDLMNYFATGPMIAVVGISSTQLHLGEQLAQTVIVIHAAVWVTVWGTIMNAIGVPNNKMAWWGLAFTGVVVLSFMTNLRSRRALMSYTIIVMQMEKTQEGYKISKPGSIGWCFLVAAAVASLQAIVPYPMLVSRKVDRIFAQSWKDVGRITGQLCDGVWSGRSISSRIETSRTECDDLGAVLDHIPGLLFFASYEPFERSLFNQLRNVRLTLLRRILVILHAMCTSATTVNRATNVITLEQQKKWKAMICEPLDVFLKAFLQVLDQMGRTLDPKQTVSACSFDALQEKKDNLLTALQSCRSYVALRRAEETDAFAFYHFLYFHTLLAFLAEELHSFAEQMQGFDPTQYKSTWRRCGEFFFLDFWDDFRSHLLSRVLLRTEEARNSLKEGIRLGIAYCVAAAFTTQLNEDLAIDNSYFFGMSIILGIGLPTASESIDVGIQRIAGLSFAISIAYLAAWKTSSFAGSMAMLVAGSFVAGCFRDNRRYQHVAFNASFVAPAAMGVAENVSALAGRVVDNSFAVLFYFVICSSLFPLNPLRVLWNRQVVYQKRMADLITLLTSVAQLPVDAEHNGIANDRLELASDIMRATSDALSSVGPWIEICSKEPIIVGKCFPTARVEAFHTLAKHTAASLEVSLFGLQILFRERLDPPHTIIQRMLGEISPILKDLEISSRAVFQDLIDAVELPKEWTVERSWRHFEDFVLVKAKLDKAFKALHKDMNHTQSKELRRQLAIAAADFGDAWLSNYSLAGSFLGNRSFIGRASFAVDPANIRTATNAGITYNIKNSFAPCEGGAASWINTSLPAIINSSFASRASAVLGTGGDRTLPCAASSSMAKQRTSVVQRPNPQGEVTSVGIPDPTRVPSLLSALPYTAVVPTRALQMSFRAPPGNLPIDVDVTAFTILVVSTSQLITALEHMVPHVHCINVFARSQLEWKSWSIRSFFMLD